MRLLVLSGLFFIALQGWCQSSVLASGQWYKLGITKTGMHKIDKSSLLKLGISDAINPKTIKLFGNGVRGVLPQKNSADRPEDLIENPIFISGEQDGSFDDNDYLLFYGIGPHKDQWAEDGFSFERNIYSDTAFYFIQIGETLGKRVTTIANPSGGAAKMITSFNDHITFEEDDINLISSGRKWVGEILSDGETKSFNYLMEGLQSEISCVITLVNQSTEAASFNVSNNGSPVATIDLKAIPNGPNTLYDRKAIEATEQFDFPSSSSLSFQVRYNGLEPAARGFIDRFSLTFRRTLSLYTNETDFRAIESSGRLAEYRINATTDATIWNITNPQAIAAQAYNVNGSVLSFINQSDEVQEYVIFSGSDFPRPFIYGSVNNQNLRGSVGADGIIISDASFLEEANRLAAFHESNDGLNVQVATPQQIYNEFSSGRQDIVAIRDYVKYIYEKGSRLKYVLLFGDCSYDYKNRLSGNFNFVPTYQSRESYHPIFSYSSDDFYGFLDNDEGFWEESVSGDHKMEVGIGRLPVKSKQEAALIVNKIIHYSTDRNTLGRWRNKMVYVADDGDSNIHAHYAEELATLADTAYTQYHIGKIFLDAFDQESGASKDLSPQASASLKTQIKNGAFVVNFLGHGNERLWTEEEILTKELISELTNRNKLPIFVTATCEFGRYDNPIEVSGAEELLLLETGGAIGLLTTSRPVFASTNFSLNRAFHEAAFQNKNRLGDIFKLTKNNGLAGPINRNFILLGDPMMLPAFPKYEVAIQDAGNLLDTLNALETITLSGEIQENGSLKKDFDGQLTATIFDASQEFKTKGQEQESVPYTYTLRSNMVFRGEASVKNGQFSFSFVVPKNISYRFEAGKLTLYAWDFHANVDASGSSNDFVIGGTARNVTLDNTPPRIRMYLNNESFQSGNTIGSSSLLIAKLSDHSGITTSSIGIIEGISLELGGQTINLNEFYTADVDSYQEGVVVYPIDDLPPGSYTANLKVWDTHNNIASSQIRFNVTNEPQIFIFNQTAYPNPATSYVNFAFDHDREEEDLTIDFIVYNGAGTIVYEEEKTFRNSSSSIEFQWNLDTNAGHALNQGVYYYRMIVRSNFDGATKEIGEKLVLSK